jgi:hypothetical protein
MATPVQSASSIVEGLLGAPPSAELLTRIGNAYAFAYRRGETLTAAQKATVFINEIRRRVREEVLNAENSQIAATAVAAAGITIDVGNDE